MSTIHAPHFYAVAVIPTDGNTTEDLAMHAESRHADVLHVGGDHILISYGPFLSTARNGFELRSDARHAASLIFAGVPHGVIAPRNVTREADQYVIDFD